MYLLLEVTTKKEERELLENLFFSDDCLGLQTIDESTFQLYYPITTNDHLEKTIASASKWYSFSYKVNTIKDENWNQLWEENYQPIFIGDYCAIYAPFHQPIGEHKHQLIINPEMAFGTGHHETTQLMIEMMQKLDFGEKSVLDLGSGTGVLALLAHKEQAKKVTAVDIDPKAYVIMNQNFTNNDANTIESILGQLSSVTNTYDVLLANITKNLILSEQSKIIDAVNPNGVLIFSGFLKNDIHDVVNAFESLGCEVKLTKVKNNWASICLEKQ